MKKILVLLLGLGLFACQKAPGNNTSDAQAEKVTAVGVGEVCGVGVEQMCQERLECFVEKDSQDGKGVCRKSIVDDALTCEPIKRPVCGRKERNKNGYLNECEARRHGAEILHEGFCKIDDSVVGNCSGKVLGMGNCEVFFQGYEFDGRRCVRVGVAGCDAEIPFQDEATCESQCE